MCECIAIAIGIIYYIVNCRKMSYVLGKVNDIKSPLIFQVYFPLEEDGPRELEGHAPKKKVMGSKFDDVTQTYSEEKEYSLYIVHLHGITYTEEIYDPKSVQGSDYYKKKKQTRYYEGMAKYVIIRHNYRRKGIYLFKFRYVSGMKIYADVYDPVTGLSMADWLVETFPNIYRKR